MSSTTKFSSEGFDLDAVPSGEKGANDLTDAIHEIGGTASISTTKKAPQSSAQNSTAVPDDLPDEIIKAEEFKSKGNDMFKAGSYFDAYVHYTDAIAAVESLSGFTPGLELLRLRDEFNEEKRRQAIERRRNETERDDDEWRKGEGNKTRADGANDDKVEDQQKSKDDEENKELAEEKFTPPIPPPSQANKIAVYHCNRAACLLHLERNEEVIHDATIALMLKPGYTKAYTRRMSGYEKMDKLDDAISDAKAALVLEPRNAQIRSNVTRLQKLNEIKMEKLKEETMGKLKDLGNSILGNFGMSLDSFKAEKDPNTGSYSISYQN